LSTEEFRIYFNRQEQSLLCTFSIDSKIEFERAFARYPFRCVSRIEALGGEQLCFAALSWFGDSVLLVAQIFSGSGQFEFRVRPSLLRF
jgi:hypothetical protein